MPRKERYIEDYPDEMAMWSVALSSDDKAVFEFENETQAHAAVFSLNRFRTLVCEKKAPGWELYGRILIRRKGNTVEMEQRKLSRHLKVIIDGRETTLEEFASPMEKALLEAEDSIDD